MKRNIFILCAVAVVVCAAAIIICSVANTNSPSAISADSPSAASELAMPHSIPVEGKTKAIKQTPETTLEKESYHADNNATESVENTEYDGFLPEVEMNEAANIAPSDKINAKNDGFGTEVEMPDDDTGVSCDGFTSEVDMLDANGDTSHSETNIDFTNDGFGTEVPMP